MLYTMYACSAHHAYAMSMQPNTIYAYAMSMQPNTIFVLHDGVIWRSYE